MPLRDHFRSPLDDVHSWDELHGMWPAMIVRGLNEVLPAEYFASPGVHLGTACPTLTPEHRWPKQDTYEVRIYRGQRRKRGLVAIIEIVSPSNKDRAETRGVFVSKAAALLQHNICVSIIDVVSTIDFNLYADLLNLLESADPALGDEPTPLYAATQRVRYDGHRHVMEAWYRPLSVGATLPTLPIWLKESLAVPLDLEASYEEACRILRIN